MTPHGFNRISSKVRHLERLSRNPHAPKTAREDVAVLKDALDAWKNGCIDVVDVLYGALDVAKDWCFRASMERDRSVKPSCERLANAFCDVVQSLVTFA